MSSPAIEVLILCAKSKLKFNPLSALIEKEEKLGFTHFAIGIIYGGQIVIAEAVWPRPHFISLDDWLKKHDPVFVFKKEVRNQFMMFEMMAWMSVIVTQAFYSVAQLVLIYLGITFPKLKAWSQTVKLNHQHGLICSEFVCLFLNKFFDFQIDKSEDSIGLKEPFDALTNTWVLQNQIQTAALIHAYSKSGP